jgi:hypothetical protein
MKGVEWSDERLPGQHREELLVVVADPLRRRLLPLHLVSGQTWKNRPRRKEQAAAFYIVHIQAMR